MIRDRGNIKWTSMMLPEHVKLLRDWAKEDEFETKEEIDEQQLEQMNEVICDAMTYGASICLTYFEGTKHYTITGTVHYVDEIEQKLRIMTSEGIRKHIPIQAITDVKEVDKEGF
ncbi:YolD-like family protein [Bacillus suaedaesalsae]|uniref:YolD-like family protein n=1 Tax=Bacillus suaedaesalsae TaxID=2810349 RepID=A0ABS2DG21_9BACI|nr:YolD-like family protein [Bacillus suaedaesalsae]MBM6617410.1 YolD-like family protein [Bacillus suaedaesalsae]